MRKKRLERRSAAGLFPFRRHWKKLLLAVLLSLCGCDVTSGIVYEIVYPSGYIRTPYTWDELTPVEGTVWQLARRTPEAEEEKEYLLLLDGEGKLLYEYPALGSPTVRGERGEGDTIWVCSEFWTAPHYNGYIHDALEKSTILLIDVSSGEILFQGEAGRNQLYLTSAGSCCYFYDPGAESGEKLFGLLDTAEQKAEIYCRDTGSWEQKRTVHTFDYAGMPSMAGVGRIEDLTFYLREDSVELVVRENDYEPDAWEESLATVWLASEEPDCFAAGKERVVPQKNE